LNEHVTCRNHQPDGSRQHAQPPESFAAGEQRNRGDHECYFKKDFAEIKSVSAAASNGRFILHF
jgi:hypothetical protein